jgi:hypothetical protein
MSRKYHRQTAATVQAIRSIHAGPWAAASVQRNLAKRFNTCQSNNSYIVRRHTWADMPSDAWRTLERIARCG